MLQRFRGSLLIIASILPAACSRQTTPVQAKQETGPIRVEVVPVQSREVRRMVESVGTLYPLDEAVISAEIDGKAEEVKYDLGDVVEKGAVLVRINDEEQRYLVQQSEAQLRQAVERLGLTSEKDRVADIRQTPDVRRAQADLLDAQQRFRRTQSLFDQKIGSQSDLEQAQAKYNSLRAQYDSTVNQTRNMVQEVERFKAILELQRKKLRDTSVHAPFRAQIKERQVSQGQFVRTNTPLFTLVKTDPVRLRIEIPERMAPWIRLNQEVTVNLEAFGDRIFLGRIERISPTVDSSKRTFVAEALIANPKGELKPGSYARAKIPTAKIDHVILVPQKAVYYILGSNKAFVVKNGVVEAREVKLGDRFDQDVEILEGLAAGEQVAVTQMQRLDTGVKVQAAPAR